MVEIPACYYLETGQEGGESGRVRKLEQAGEYQILFCEACRLRFSHPMTHPGQGFYEDSGLYENRDIGNVSLSLPSLEWRYVTFLKQARPAKGSRLLDVGCGDGGVALRTAATSAPAWTTSATERNERSVHIGAAVR